MTISKTYRLPEVIGSLVKKMLKTESVDSILARLMGKDFIAVPSDKHLGMELEMIREEMKEFEKQLSTKYEQEISDLRKQVDKFTNEAVKLKELHAQIHAEKREWNEVKKKDGFVVSKDTTSITNYLNQKVTPSVENDAASQKTFEQVTKKIKEVDGQKFFVNSDGTQIEIIKVDRKKIEDYAEILKLNPTWNNSYQFPYELTDDLAGAIIDFSLGINNPRQNSLVPGIEMMFFGTFGLFTIPQEEVMKVLYRFSEVAYDNYGGNELDRLESVLKSIQNIVAGDFDINIDLVETFNVTQDRAELFKAGIDNNNVDFKLYNMIQADDYVEIDEELEEMYP